MREGEVWVFSCFYKQSVGSSTSGVLAFTYLDGSLSAISSASIALGESASANTWTRAAQKVTIPAGARFGEISFTWINTYSGTLTVDSVDALRGVAWSAWANASYQNSWSDANLAVYGAVRYRYTDLGEVELRGMAKAPTPAPAAGANIFTQPSPARPNTKRVWRIGDSSSLVRSLTIDTPGRVQLSGIDPVGEVSLDGIRFFVD